MKVICKENKDVNGKLNPLLTINKVYDAKIKDTIYIINNDYMFMDKFYFKHFFVNITKIEQHREQQLNKIGIE